MARSNGEKEKQILEFIENQTKREKWEMLSKDEIIKSLSDEEFDVYDIKGILKDLEKKERIISEDLRFHVYLPKSEVKSIQKKLKKYLVSTQNLLYLISFLILAGALSNESFFKYFLNFVFRIGESTSNYNIIVGGFILSFALIIVINIFVTKASNLIQEGLPKIKEYMWIFYTLFTFALLGIFLHKFLSISNEASSTIAVLGGVGMLSVIYFIKRDKMKDTNSKRKY